jgi:aryl-alcohol dehydrogenase-like predicted oxidoreductase
MLHKEELLSLWHNELSEIFHDLVLSGRIKQAGVSVYSPDKAIQALNTEGIDIVQLPTNILDRRFENAGVFQLADQKKKQIYVRSVFLQGLLLMNPEHIPDNMAFSKPILEKLGFLARNFGITHQEMALCYIKENVPNAKVIFGADIPSHVKENCICWRKNPPSTLISSVRDSFLQIDERILNPALWPK